MVPAARIPARPSVAPPSLLLLPVLALVLLRPGHGGDLILQVRRPLHHLRRRLLVRPRAVFHYKLPGFRVQQGHVLLAEIGLEGAEQGRQEQVVELLGAAEDRQVGAEPPLQLLVVGDDFGEVRLLEDRLHRADGAVDDPEREPLFVVLLRRRVDGAEAHERGVEKYHRVVDGAEDVFNEGHDGNLTGKHRRRWSGEGCGLRGEVKVTLVETFEYRLLSIAD
mmetsp:Transcript_36666/g.72091  ORF Transcript_36666/g.72091 Transcript_36666/m.72091 type:complete len:222 (+) Transcript_36666:38-703(+)